MEPATKKLKGEDGSAVDAAQDADQDTQAADGAQDTLAPANPKAASPVVAGAEGGMVFDSDAMEVAIQQPQMPEGPKELEEDAADDKRKRITVFPSVQVPDTTLNVMVGSVGNMLMMLNEGGFQYLLAGARANVGIKSGRYMFEARIIELLQQVDASGMQTRTPMPKHTLRIGFSVSGSVPILGDTEESICFDSEGGMLFNKRRIPIHVKFGPENVVAVVLNLDANSPNANTISLFRDGVRACEPQPLPEVLRGKALFPSVTFKNMNVHCNYGPAQMAPLPFKCRMVSEAAAEDSQVVSYAAGGKHEVIFPVCLPDEGTFDWVDWFIEKNPHFAELSERKIVEWAVRSGCFKPKTSSIKASNDRPDTNFGAPGLDDGGVKHVLHAAAASQHRDLIYMEVKGNLSKDERKEALAKFRMPHLKKVAKVMVGKPAKDFHEYVLEKLRLEKQEKLELEFQTKRQEKARLRLLEMQKKQVEWARKKAEKEAKKAAEGEEGEAAEEAAEEEEEQPPTMEVDEEEECPKAELTEEEKQQLFRKFESPALKDLSEFVISQSFASFTLPSADEGFDEVEYAWLAKAASETYLKQWIRDRKVTTRLEDIQPTDYFKDKWQSWQRDLQSWHVKHMEMKDPVKRAAALAAKEAGNKTAEGVKKEESEKTEETEKKDETEAKKEEGAEAKDKQAEEADDTTDYMKQLEEELEQKEEDVFAVENVFDTGNCEPLFHHFQFEDWALLSLRFEIHLLAHSFKHDCGDPERVGIHVDHLLFYYNKYYKKGLNTKNYGVDSVQEILELIKDTIIVCGPKVVESQLEAELETNDIFIKLAEESRRDRLRRIDAGEEGAQLKFAGRPMMEPPSLQAAGSKMPAVAGLQGIMAKGMGKGAPGISQQQMMMQQQQQRQPFLRQQLQQGMMQNQAGAQGGVQQRMQGMQQNVPAAFSGARPGMTSGVPLAQQRMLAQQRGFGGQGW
eukprot:TRINITY_DN3296_c1_g1_i1.p1 TRINITY_DN3296_c1_g1~~TRINITY_DN3296_c1_g1_i1.p1  ORF type:complete len:963 (-),score=309.24 TRINITY_DN3296_c1_g1_i1:677-3565(-)